MSKKPRPEQEAAFTLASDDRFHRILVSEGVKFEAAPGYETVLCFFVIRRSTGTYSLVNLVKTFHHDKCERRSVQTKDGVLAADVEQEVAKLTGAFTQAIEEQSGKKLIWHALDLSGVTDMHQQAALISEWGRVKAWIEAPPEYWKPSQN